jgi:hypothetical protein
MVAVWQGTVYKTANPFNHSNNFFMYKAILFHPEGDFVTDFNDNNEVQDVWDQVADMGSKWVFYPLVFVAADKTIKDTPNGLEFLKGKRIQTVKKYFIDKWAANADEICKYINNGWPLSDIYQPQP